MAELNKMATSNVQPNEIVKASDFEFGFDNIVNNVALAGRLIFDTQKDFVIGGKISPAGDTGLNIVLSPVFGVNQSTGILAADSLVSNSYGLTASTGDRTATIQIKGELQTYDEQQRAFKDYDTDVKTYEYVDTKKQLAVVINAKYAEGNTAPEHDPDFIKIAEIFIPANAENMAQCEIRNITSDTVTLENSAWTNEKDSTYNIGYMSELNRRFRIKHNEDGSHKEKVIGSKELDTGINTNQVNGRILPVNTQKTVGDQAIALSDSITTSIEKIITVVSAMYNLYMQYGDYSFKGELAISDVIDDETNELVNALKLSADGEGNAVLKLDDTTILTASKNPSSGNYTFTVGTNYSVNTTAKDPSSVKIVTTAITNAIWDKIANFEQRLKQIESASDSSTDGNKIVSADKFTYYDGVITLATTESIDVTNLTSHIKIDGVDTIDNMVILVKDEEDPKNNGIWMANGSNFWQRVTTFLAPETMVKKLFEITGGTVNKGRIFYLPKESYTHMDEFGYDDIEIIEYFGAKKSIPNRVVVRDKDNNIDVEKIKGSKPALYTDDIKPGDLLIVDDNNKIKPLTFTIDTSVENQIAHYFTDSISGLVIPKGIYQYALAGGGGGGGYQYYGGAGGGSSCMECEKQGIFLAANGGGGGGGYGTMKTSSQSSTSFYMYASGIGGRGAENGMSGTSGDASYTSSSYTYGKAAMGGAGACVTGTLILKEDSTFNITIGRGGGKGVSSTARGGKGKTDGSNASGNDGGNGGMTSSKFFLVGTTSYNFYSGGLAGNGGNVNAAGGNGYFYIRSLILF